MPSSITRLLVLLSCLSLVAAAQDIVVPPSGSIQAAIVASASGGRVLVPPGTYTEQIDFLGKAIQVIGLQGAQQTTINGGGSGPVVSFASGEGTTSVLRGFTITGGSSTFGAGGIRASLGATPTILDCVIKQNNGRNGGGVSGNPILRRWRD